METMNTPPSWEAQSPMSTGPSPKPVAAVAGREVELKLHCAPADLERLAGHALFAAADDRATRRQHTVYHDTPDLRLAAAGVALRVRRQGKGYVQSVKTMGGETQGDAAAVAVCREWEWPLADEAPDLALLAADGVRPMIPAGALPEIKPVFITDIDRTTFVLRPDPLTAIEVALDLGSIRAGTAARPVSEIELELKAGPIGRLFELALEMQRLVPLRIANASKAETGLSLVSGRGPQPIQPEPLGLSPATTVAEAFRHIVRHCLRQLLANEAATLAGLPLDSLSPEGGHVEGLHQMRVALRRLRMALKLFADALDAPELSGLVGESRWLANRLTPARHWDVFLSSFLEPYARRHEGLPGLDGLTDEAAKARHGAALTAMAAIQEPRYTNFLLTLGRWLEEGRWHVGADAAHRARLDRPMRELAGPWLDEGQRKARRAIKNFHDVDTDDLDRLRRRVRRLRHAADFFRGLYPPTRTRPFMATLLSMQEILDDLYDAATAQELLRKLGQTGGRAFRPAVAGLEHWIDRRADRRLGPLGEAWRSFKDAEPFWG